MATIRMTAGIASQIYRSFYSPLRAYYIAQRNRVPDGLGDRVYDVLMGDYLPALTSLPEEFHYKTRTLSVQVDESSLPIEFRYSIPRVFVPPVRDVEDVDILGGKLRRSSQYKYSDTYYVMTNPHLWGSVGEELKTFALQRRTYDGNAAQLHAHFDRLLRMNQTLQQVVKAFPALMPFIPEQYLFDLKQSKARTCRTEGVDIDFLTGQAALLRVIQPE